MKVRHLIEMLAENPELGDYDLCISGYMVLKEAEFEDGTKEDMEIVVDNPIIGIATNETTKELRFVLKSSDLDVLEKSDTMLTRFDD